MVGSRKIEWNFIVRCIAAIVSGICVKYKALNPSEPSAPPSSTVGRRCSLKTWPIFLTSPSMRRNPPSSGSTTTKNRKDHRRGLWEISSLWKVRMIALTPLFWRYSFITSTNTRTDFIFLFRSVSTILQLRWEEKTNFQESEETVPWRADALPSVILTNDHWILGWRLRSAPSSLQVVTQWTIPFRIWWSKDVLGLLRVETGISKHVHVYCAVIKLNKLFCGFK